MYIIHSTPTEELPPRARRIHDFVQAGGDTVGTTSACAENTAHPLDAARLIGNYLRVRGEYGGACHLAFDESELPPRARRIHLVTFIKPNLGGTTSACAENTD